LLIHPTKYIA